MGKSEEIANVLRFGAGLGKLAFPLTVPQLLSGKSERLCCSAQKPVPEAFSVSQADQQHLKTSF